MFYVAPSLLAADFSDLKSEIKRMEEAGANYLHLDVMDGHFVPNLTFGPYILAAMKKQTPDIVYDVHLMLTDPLTMIDSYAKAGASVITVHAEANGFEESLRRIRELGLVAGASINPATPAEVLRPYLHLIDRVLLMTVVPGFGGQKFMPEALPKVRELREMGFTGEIEADGGVTPDNMQQAVEAGVDILVMGTAFFKAEDPYEVSRLVHAL